MEGELGTAWDASTPRGGRIRRGRPVFVGRLAAGTGRGLAILGCMMTKEQAPVIGASNEEQAEGLCHTVSFTLGYNGAPFAGFARQAESHVKTVQGELERALSLLYRREVKTVCAGRTDAGVHALGQVVSFDLTEDEMRAKTPRSLQRSMNALVDDGISISAVEERPFGFSARFDARWREYHYHICTQSARPVLVMPLVWHLGGVDLDVEAMRSAASRLVGERDFKSFCMAASAHIIEADGRSTCRNVMSCDVYSEMLAGTPVVTVRVVGNAFLHSMVRTMVGTLVEVGRGKRDAAWVDDVLAARDRSAAGQNAPAAGLTFWRVGYDDYRSDAVR